MAHSCEIPNVSMLMPVLHPIPRRTAWMVLQLIGGADESALDDGIIAMYALWIIGLGLASNSVF